MAEARVDLDTRDAWRFDAECRGLDPDMFFPERGDYRPVKAAREVCNRCPVKATCLQENLWERDGIYGGATPSERKKMRKQYRATHTRKCAECARTFLAKSVKQMTCSAECQQKRKAKMKQQRKQQLRALQSVRQEGQT